ncbi:hypothetical protein [Sphingobacterium faecium]|uniref:hypothetical protein n=1 Tax=Sphingobacterium faecium TaxID=34087 RepID=UPI002468F8C6|nr:hypothetical protein [Sphingobacterium faecium]MDH5825805.1 hypothetical protein [Sphingobacterium faecium]
MCTIVPIVKQCLIDIGTPQYEVKTNEIVHMYLRERYCPPVEVWSDEKQKYIVQPASVKSLTNTQFFQFKEDIQGWATSFLGVYIPDPNEDIKSWQIIPDKNLSNHDNKTD